MLLYKEVVKPILAEYGFKINEKDFIVNGTGVLAHARTGQRHRFDGTQDYCRYLRRLCQSRGRRIFRQDQLKSTEAAPMRQGFWQNMLSKKS